MTPSEERFLAIKDRYLIAYKENNYKEVYKIWFDKGWVNLQSSESSSSYKFRVNQFETMCNNLESHKALNWDWIRIIKV